MRSELANIDLVRIRGAVDADEHLRSELTDRTIRSNGCPLHIHGRVLKPHSGEARRVPDRSSPGARTLLRAPNLVASHVGGRTCLACARARATLQTAAKRGEVLALKVESDRHYALIMAGAA